MVSMLPRRTVISATSPIEQLLMNGHTTEEPLYTLLFGMAQRANEFVQTVRQAMRFKNVHRYTPPGPLVIYGPPQLTNASAVTLFVTAGILRVAEILDFELPARGHELAGAGALPQDVVVLFAHLGGSAAPADE